MKRSVGLLFPVVLLWLCLYTPAAHADSVVLTGGTVTASTSNGTINLTGNNFSLNYFGETQGNPQLFNVNTVTLGLGNPSVTYQGTTSTIFRGLVNFNNSTITGSVTAFASMNDMFFNVNPLFTVGFTGSGLIGLGTTETRFTVTPTATPEPNTLIQLLIGLVAGSSLIARRVNHRSLQ